MQPVAGEVEGLRRRRLIEAGKNVLYRFQQISPYPAPVAAFIQPFQAPMLETSDQQDTL